MLNNYSNYYYTDKELQLSIVSILLTESNNVLMELAILKYDDGNENGNNGIALT